VGVLRAHGVFDRGSSRQNWLLVRSAELSVRGMPKARILRLHHAALALSSARPDYRTIVGVDVEVREFLRVENHRLEIVLPNFEHRKTSAQDHPEATTSTAWIASRKREGLPERELRRQGSS